MKPFFLRKLLLLIGMMVFLSLLGAGVVKLSDSAKPTADRGEGVMIITSFYPMYVAALNLTDGIDGVQVRNLTENQSGCLHDYQLTTSDLRILETADILILNGADMEHFMEGISGSYPELAVITATEGISLLQGSAHDHIHEGENQSEPDGEEEAANGHVWMDPKRYRQQLNNISTELSRLDPEHAEQYEANRVRYETELAKLEDEISELSAELQGAEIVIFHEAFAYLAEALGLTVVHTLNLDEDSSLSAGEIAQVVDEIRLHGIEILWTEEQVADSASEAVAEETGCEVLVLSALTGEPKLLTSPKNAYLEGMRENLLKLRSGMVPGGKVSQGGRLLRSRGSQSGGLLRNSKVWMQPETEVQG